MSQTPETLEGAILSKLDLMEPIKPNNIERANYIISLFSSLYSLGVRSKKRILEYF